MSQFFHKTVVQYHFLHDHSLYHLDNPDPVEKETISNPKNSQYPSGWDYKIRIVYTTGVYTCCASL